MGCHDIQKGGAADTRTTRHVPGHLAGWMPGVCCRIHRVMSCSFTALHPRHIGA